MPIEHGDLNHFFLVTVQRNNVVGKLTPIQEARVQNMLQCAIQEVAKSEKPFADIAPATRRRAPKIFQS